MADPERQPSGLPRISRRKLFGVFAGGAATIAATGGITAYVLNRSTEDTKDSLETQFASQFDQVFEDGLNIASRKGQSVIDSFSFWRNVDPTTHITLTRTEAGELRNIDIIVRSNAENGITTDHRLYSITGSEFEAHSVHPVGDNGKSEKTPLEVTPADLQSLFPKILGTMVWADAHDTFEVPEQGLATN